MEVDPASSVLGPRSSDDEAVAGASVLGPQSSDEIAAETSEDRGLRTEDRREDVAVADENPQRVVRRIRRMAVAAYLGFSVFMLIRGGFYGFLGLTCCAAVTMIAFLWLEEIAGMLLQPAAHPHARRLMWRTVARFVLLGVALMVTIFVARFDALGVLLGFSIVVVGIMGEALYAVFRSFAGN